MEAEVKVPTTGTDVQVVAKPHRRVFTAEYKRRILKAADACATPGAVGALLRREGLYSSVDDHEKARNSRPAEGKGAGRGLRAQGEVR